MSDIKDLLVELGTEELPSLSLKPLQKAIQKSLSALLEEQRLTFIKLETLASPRRLAVRVSGLSVQQPDSNQQRLGPKREAAYDAEGKPTQAALGFAESCRVGISALQEIETDKGVRLGINISERGEKASILIPKLLEKLFQSLPLPKKMRWGDNSYSFIRPIHWLLVLFGQEVLSAEIFGVKASNKSYGHRFMHPGPVIISDPQEYEKALKEVFVIVNFDERKKLIREQIKHVAENVKGVADVRETLLDEVVGLVEWPQALLVEFDESFLQVPEEALISAMESHQKCFPVRGANGQLMPCFITLSNIETKSFTKIIDGNQRVMRARLADAEYFYQSDQKIPFESRAGLLEVITFQEKLGSLGGKVARIEALSLWLAKALNADVAKVVMAAKNAKNDLTTEMVGEFPELQGVMGYYYATAAGMPVSVAVAIKEHYYPRFAGDVLPSSLEGSVVSMADKMDTILGIFSIGKGPTGEKDPFALRRAALGVLRIILEQNLDIDLKALIRTASEGYKNKITSEIEANVFHFFLDRLRAWCQDGGISTNVINAVMVRKPSNPLDFKKRIDAVCDFIQLDEADSLAKANKRVTNILKKTKDFNFYAVNESLLIEPAEKILAQAMAKQKIKVIPLYEQREYAAGLKALAELKQPVDTFFDDVLVNAEDEKLKHNRLTLLKELQELFLEVADISQLSQ